MSSILPDSTPQWEGHIRDTSYALRRIIPAFPGFRYGFLYGTQCKNRQVVCVPVSYGFRGDTRLCGVRDLCTEFWVPSVLPPNIGNSTLGQLRVDHFPYGSNVALEYSYTIFYVPQSSRPPETQINTCEPVTRAGVPWFGNVLVVRHGKMNPVIGVEEADAHLVDVILQSLIMAGALA
ncbi:hypothetical protein MSAN_02103500 [Mycena sanguinolenta]|uniref:Uncharacterized protein n=1 Tax=Mycena sanguinolenta TaxID=230812 RepID=A0A8H7CLS1_9AGAR|nr:hypothetical protein MSAN_02103500 [Mycena sanguinolenta]